MSNFSKHNYVSPIAHATPKNFTIFIHKHVESFECHSQVPKEVDDRKGHE